MLLEHTVVQTGILGLGAVAHSCMQRTIPNEKRKAKVTAQEEA
jgi:hypothetical protein